MKTIKDLFLEVKTDMTPPAGVKSACKLGLKLKADHGGDGLTSAAVAWAKKMASGQPVSAEKIRKMNAFFARHKVDKKPGWDSPPTPGYVAWQLWGGEAGRSWASAMVKKLDKGVSDTSEASEPKWKRKGLVGPGGAEKTAERQAAKQGKKKNKAYKAAIYAKMTGKR